MQTTTLTKFKPFLAWEDEKEEAWLAEMSQQGWHLQLTRFEWPGVYRFEKGEPRHFVYRLDYSMSRQEKQFQSYLQLFRDAGWDYLGEFGGWQYFRIEAEENTAPEIYSDAASKVSKYQRSLLFYLPLIPFFILMLNDPTQWPHWWFFQGIYAIWIVIIAIYFINSIMLLRRIRQLKKKL